MGLATIDHKVQTKHNKISKFCVNRTNSKRDTATCKCQNLKNEEMHGHPDAVPNTASIL